MSDGKSGRIIIESARSGAVMNDIEQGRAIQRASSPIACAVAALMLLAGCSGLVAPASIAPPASTAAPADSAGGFASSGAPFRIGAVFPTSGNAAPLAGAELAGLRIAVDLVNADGGVAGHPIALEVRDLESSSGADGVMAAFKESGIRVVVGSYSSDLSIAASAAADRAGLLYWESGAVADRLTGRGLPMVFRVGASGTNLGSNSATFAATQLAQRLGKTTATLRVAIVAADDDYARSVADAAATTAASQDMPIVVRLTYNLSFPNWPTVMSQLAAAHPDAIILASHIPDGVAFRQAMLAAGLKVGALIGSTMAECDPDFAGDLGADAIGIFASDRPTVGFRPEALDGVARAAYDRFAAAWAAVAPSVAMPTPSGTPEYPLTGPSEQPTAEASEEALAGFSAGWALFRDVLPLAVNAGGTATGTNGPDATSVATAARTVDLPVGSLPNGAGLQFSADPATLGQNDRAAAVIWQWQAVRTYAFVWPSSYATGPIAFVPLPR
jgi:branched-chain amino acid transport system substrate-binding protein